MWGSRVARLSEPSSGRGGPKFMGVERRLWISCANFGRSARNTARRAVPPKPVPQSPTILWIPMSMSLTSSIARRRIFVLARWATMFTIACVLLMVSARVLGQSTPGSTTTPPAATTPAAPSTSPTASGQTSLMSLFQMITLDNWSELFHAAQELRPVAAVVFFVSFILLGTMVMLNLFIGVIMSSMSEMHDEIEARDRARHMKETGGTTLEDELRLLERHMKELQEQTAGLRRRCAGESGAQRVEIRRAGASRVQRHGGNTLWPDPTNTGQTSPGLAQSASATVRTQYRF